MTMGIRESLCSFWTSVRVALLTAVLAVTMSPVASAQTDPNQGAGGPVLVVTSSTATFGKYYAEILRAEGLNAFSVADISTVSAATLSSYDAVILAEVTLNATQVSTLTTWVNGGGNLIAMNPDPQLASLLGVTATAATLSNQYLKFDTTNAIAAKIIGDTIQFHGAAKLVTLNGATALATLYSNATTATSNPAVTLRSVGSNGGQAAMFAFDLARSIVYTRQGNPAWAGQDRDGIAPVRSDDMFFGNLASDPQADWVNLGKVAIAQADEQQRFLANLITSMTLDRKPLPRFWYFPNEYKAAIVMTGDDHGTWYNGPGGSTVTRFGQFANASPAGCSVEDWECVRGTSYLFSSSAVSPEQASSLTAAGFELGVHILTGVSAADDCHNFTQSSLAAIYSSQISAYQQKYPSLPAPVTMRHHCIVWSDWASAAKVELANGIRLDTNYYYWPPGWVNNVPGQFTGSAMPMRFADTDGTLIDVYQAVTQMTDESGQTYPFTVDTLLDRAVGPEEQYGVYTVNAHTDEPTTTASDSTLVSAQARGVPIVSAKQMLTWLDGRNSSTFGSISWNGSALSFTVTQATGARGLRGLLPARGDGGTTVQTLTRGGVSVAFELETIKGVEYATFPATSGSYVATYAVDSTPPTVSSRSPAAGATAVPTYESVKVVFSEPMNAASITSSSFELRNASNALVPATVTYDVVTRTATLAPSAALAASTTYTVNVKGGTTDPRVKDSSGNALASTASWTFTTWTAPTCNPCSVWNSSATPTLASTDDPAGVELGMKFTAALDGVVTGVRFYKGPLNTGVHVAHLWSASGSPIATATFQNETASGWQEVQFSSPVAVTANTTYVVSYYAPNGGYSIDENYFNNYSPGNSPLRPLTQQESGGNGVFKYGSGNIYPDQSYLSSNYWVDVVFVSGAASDTTPPTITNRSPSANATGVSTGAVVTATFSEGMAPGSIDGTTIQLRDSTSATVPATVTYSAATRTATLAPTSPLNAEATYTATVRGGATPPVVQDASGNALAATSTWSFTTAGATACPCVLWPSSTTPTIVTENDPAPVQLGVKFRSDVPGRITGIRFYKGAANLGPHVGSLWNAAGESMASATFQNETAEGWQEVQFSTPVQIQANTTYIAAYFAPNGYYSSDSGYFETNGVDNGVLHAPNNASSGGNGVFAYGGSANSFPNQTYGSSNYWVQPVFVLGTTDSSAPTVTINSPTTAGSYSTSVSPLSLAGVAADDTAVTTVTWTNSLGGSGSATGTSSWTIGGVALQPGLNTITVTAADASNKTGSAILSVTYNPPADNIPPTVQGVSPTHGSTGVPISGSIIATFSESMLASSISSSSIELRNASNTLIPTTVTYNAAAFSAAIQPTSALAPNTSYTVRVRGGAADPRVKDVAGNALTADFTWSFTTGTATGCSSSAVAAENCLTGNLQSEWDVTGAGDPSIQGFATSMSVNRGETIQFKVNTPASSYRFDIYRMGYYGGRGARFITSFAPSVTLPQSQDPCPVQNSTGLIDCSLWKVSASWQVPADAVSGIYFAKLVRTDPGGGGGSSHIVFVVRDDSSTSKMVFQTSDTTWQAYNTWGGNSLYQGSPGTNPGRAYKVSYNRPFNTRSVDGGQDWVFNAEYPMVRFLEANGYDVTYISGLDTDRAGALLLNHKVFLSVGHDEYWSGNQRANVEAARAAGVHLAFFSGNEVFWKTRWEPSVDGTPNRTLVSYKETHANGKIDPTPTWTGTWRDGRYSSDGGKPENLLTGTLFSVNAGTSNIRVPEAMGKFRFWRGTPVASQSSNNTAQLPDGTLGYEWDKAPNNGVSPPGLVRMSLATVANVDVLQDFGSTYAIAPETHSITLYKHSSGALVFGAGTVQWSWGLDSNHDRGNAPADISMQQATVNLFADMGVTPGTIQSGLQVVPMAADNTAPAAVISTPANGATIVVNSNTTISGTASDAGGKVGAVEVSVDGGTTWFTASGTTAWSYTWKPTALGSATIRARSVDDSGNISPVTTATVTVATNAPMTCPCSFWDNSTVPATVDDNDAQPIQTGVKFTSQVAGEVTAIRFYKGPLNTGTHIGSLWTGTGQLISSVTFQNETASGWQQMNFPAPIAIQPNTVYVAAYYSPNGHYPGEDNFFTGNSANAGPLTAPATEDVAGGNGVFKYGPATNFPDETYLGENYWVDVVFTTTSGSGDTTAPVLALTTPTTSSRYSTSAPTVNLSGTASDAVGVTQVTWTNDRGGNGTATGTTSWSATDVALQSGVNVITVSGRDAAGNTGTKVLNVTYTPVVADTVNPTVTITSPTNGTTFSTSATPITIGGTASDNVGVTQVTWSNSLTGGTGTATGTATWSASGITLAAGLNTITITARDAAGNVNSDTLGVTYTAPPDTTNPTVTLSSPTTGTSFSTTGTSVNLAGAANDNVGVTQVSWTSNKGISGTATGTNSWSASNVRVVRGSNTLTITARDAAGNQGIRTLTVTSSAAADSTLPSISISSPTSSGSYTTTTNQVSLSGTASDNDLLVSVTWTNNRGGNGTATGTLPAQTVSWSVPTIELQPGVNTVTVTAKDLSGNQRVTTLNVTFNAPLTYGQVGAWNFNEGSGATVADASGNNNVGTVTSGTWTSSGRFGNALQFNGTASRVFVPASTSLNLTSGMTMMAWVYPTTNSQTGNRTIIRRESNGYWLYAGRSGATLRPGGGTYTGTSSTVQANVSSLLGSPLPANQWSHVALTYDGSTMRLYVNGSQVSSASGTGTIVSGNNPLYIGGTSLGEVFTGRIDEVRLYNRALSAADVSTASTTAIP